MHKIEQTKNIQTAMWDLIMKTVDALKSDISKQLLVSVQRINVEICIKYAVERQVNCCHSLGLVEISFIFRGPIFKIIRCMTSQMINYILRYSSWCLFGITAVQLYGGTVAFRQFGDSLWELFQWFPSQVGWCRIDITL